MRTIAALAIAVAVALWIRVGAQSDATWWIHSTLESRQTTDTTNGKTTTTDSLHNASDQNSSEGEHLDYDDVSKRSADGTQYDNSTTNHQSPDGSTWANRYSSYVDQSGTRTVNVRTVEVDSEGNRTITSRTDQYDRTGKNISHRDDVKQDKVEPPPKPPKPQKEEPPKEEPQTPPPPGPPGPSGPQPPKRSNPSAAGRAPQTTGEPGARHVEVNTTRVCIGHVHRTDGDSRIDDDVTVRLQERVVYRSTGATLDGDCSEYSTGCEVISHDNHVSATGGGTATSPSGSASWTYQSDDRTVGQQTGVWLNFETGRGGSGGNCQFAQAANLRTNTGGGGAAAVVLQIPTMQPIIDEAQLAITFPPHAAEFSATAAGRGTATVAQLGTVDMQQQYSLKSGGGAASPPAARTADVVIPDGEVFPMVIQTPKGRIVGMPLNMGQKATVHAVRSTFDRVSIQVLSPSGSVVAEAASGAPAFVLSATTATTGGTYQILVLPANGQSGRIGIFATSK